MGTHQGQTRSRIASTSALGLVAATLGLLGTAVVSASPASATVTIDAPASPRAGSVELSGQVGAEPGAVTTVAYVFDATRSTSSQAGMDCSGNGVTGADDDLNADGSIGDVLDCEIAGVTALNRSLAANSGLQVGLVGFANQAAAADLDPVGTATFVPPGYTGGDARPRIDTVATSVTRDRIGLYDPRDLGGSGAGTAFNNAVSVALSTLDTAPPGPKWIMFLSDGQAAIDDGLLGRLAGSGVRLRSFGIGTGATCAPSGSLYKMAAATGEACQVAANPASLTAGLTGSRPDAINGVTVSVDDVSVAADLDAIGGWRARFTLGAGTYTATVRATLASGRVQSAQRRFTVAPAAGGPAPGTIDAGPGALKATAVAVARPEPSRTPLPSRVTGRVGRPVRGLTTAPALRGAVVLLQARAAVGAPWTTVDRDRVNRSGRFVLTWWPAVRLHLMRVVLQPKAGFAGSAAAVPKAAMSGCKVKGRSVGWSVTCRTTAPTGSVARLLQDGKVVDRSRVRRGGVRLLGKGSVGTYTIHLAVGRKRHVQLPL